MHTSTPLKLILYISLLATFLSACVLVPEPTATPSPAPSEPKTIPQDALCLQAGVSSTSFTLDGVEIIVCAAFPLGEMFLPAPGDIVQAASALEASAAPSVSLLAVPFGMPPATEDLPAAQRGMAETWLQRLKEFRQSNNAELLEVNSITFFGKQTQGIFSLVSNDEGSYALVAEWTAEAGERVWLVRLVKAYPSRPTSGDIEVFTNKFVKYFSISSPDVARPSVSKSVAEKPSPYIPKEIPGITDLPVPAWWNGECNVKNYSGSYYLGSSYRGVKACGPVGSAVRVNFGAGVTQLEWQCTELSKRFLYLAYGIPPYLADGKKIVDNYSGTLLVKIKNATVGVAPQPGDVLSYGPNTTYGHTSVVSAANVDSSGNGYITIIEQNNSSSGTRKHTVKNWVVQDALTITAWLHDPRSGVPCSSVLLNSPADGTVASSPAVAFSWLTSAGCTFSGYTFRIKDVADMESGGNTVFSTDTAQTSIVFTLEAQWLNKNLFWGVKAPGTAWAVRSFRVEAQVEEPTPPAAPILLSPANGSALTSTPQLCWQPGSARSDVTFTYQVSLQGTSSLQSEWLADTCFTPQPLSPGSYLWSVTARDGNGILSEASLSSMLIIEQMPPTMTPTTTSIITPTPLVAPQPTLAEPQQPISLPFYEKLMEWIDSNFITYLIKQLWIDWFK